MPSGLSLNSSTGLLNGTPTAAGTFVFIVTATDNNGVTGSQAYSLTVTATSSTSLSGPTLVVVGQPATFTATVTGAAPTPSGLVTLYDGSNIIASGSLDNTGHASFLTSTLTLGSHTLTAVYNGDSTHAGSTSNPWGVSVVSPNFSDNFAQPSSASSAVAATSDGFVIPSSGSYTLNVGSTTGFASSGLLTVLMQTGAASTTTSSSFALPANVINVGSTSGFASFGSLAIMTSNGQFAVINYTGTTSTSFTGCSGTGGSNFVNSGVTVVPGAFQLINYAGTSGGNSFTGCLGGSGLSRC